MRFCNIHSLPLLVAINAGPLIALQAGALDGQWCSEDGRTIRVSGIDIVAANGLHATGTYRKNALYFTEPRLDGRDGPEIWMEPKGPDAVRVSVLSPKQKEPPPHDLWRRCQATSFSSHGAAG